MENILSVAETFFTGGWRMALETDIPGTDISVAGFAVALFLISFSIRIIGFMTGFRGGGSYGRAANAAEKAKNTYQKYKGKNG